MSSKRELWRELKVGDRIRLVHMPTEFERPGYRLQDCTRIVYQHLIDTRRILVVEKIDKWSCPWTESFILVRNGTEEHHWIMINHDGLERVD